MTARVVTAVAAVALIASSCGGSNDTATPRVEVPNTILRELVERVACVGELDVVVADEVAVDAAPPLAVLALDPTDVTATDATLVISVPESASALETTTGVDPQVWTDPIRYRELSESVAGALVGDAGFDGELIDRCLTRIDAEMTQLDEELFATLEILSDDQRVLDIDAPGAVYFATRYEFAPSTLPVATAAGEIVSVDELGDADSYESLMRDVVDGVIATLTAN